MTVFAAFTYTQTHTHKPKIGYTINQHSNYLRVAMFTFDVDKWGT